MDHHHYYSWRPIPGNNTNNICPTCSISHFPFCLPTRYPPPPPPNNNNNNKNNFNNIDPGYWNRNPSFVDVNTAPYLVQNPAYTGSGFVGNRRYNGNNKNNNDDDVNNDNNASRSSKRLRVDGICPVVGSYGEGDGSNSTSTLSNVFLPEENERRLRLIRDHGGPNSGSGGYGQESFVFDRNVVGDARDDLGNVDVGYASVNHQRQHGSMGSMFSNHDQHLSQYGQGTKQPDPMALNQGGIGHDRDSRLYGFHYSSYGSSHVPNESGYGSNLESMHSRNASQHYEPRSDMSMPNQYSGSQLPYANTKQQPDQMRYGYHSPSHFNDIRLPLEARAWPVEGCHHPFGDQNVPMRPCHGPTHMDNQGGYVNLVSDNMSQVRASQGFDVRPPLPASPPPPLPVEPPGQWSADYRPLSSSPKVSSALFPVPVSSSAAIQYSYVPNADSRMRAHQYPQNSQLPHPSRCMPQVDSQANLPSSGHYLGETQPFSSKKNFPDKPKVIDASRLFKPPYRATRPDHFVIILRGLPGSGKSYLAKMLRDLEVEHGGNAPRIHSMDDYFMTEVEKADENEASKSSGRGKKATMKKVLEFYYEPEMEEAYRASMLKSFKKTLEEGVFTFVIVDDRNLRVADFAQFWATAKRSGYEVYVLEAPYKDPVGCTARNVHGFAQDDVEKMATQWEEAPSLYIKLDVKSLFHGDDLTKGDIQEVDMDTEDWDVAGSSPTLEEREPEKIFASSGGDCGPDVSRKGGRSFSDAEGDNPTEEVKDLRRSKWSTNLDEEDDEKNEEFKGKPNVLSGMPRTYGKEGKSVHWGDQGGHTGFSIGAVKKANVASLVIGPGAGYNLKSNPLCDEVTQTAKSGETKKHSMFKERLRAEQESFKAVFDRRRKRQRIGGFDAEED